jgi:RND family efflux transporter MFP subunit
LGAEPCCFSAVVALLLVAVDTFAAVIAAVVLLKPTPKPQPRQQPLAPLVTVMVAEPGPVALQIDAQGTVEPKVSVELVTRVSGQVVSVAPQFSAGGFFAANQPLVQIERADFEFAVVRAKASLARAEEALALERGRARQAQREWRDLGDDIANALFLREPQLAAAEAGVVAAQADLAKAELDLTRTRISLPFAGRVEQITVNVGQFVATGTRLGRVYASQQAELRLPLTLRQADLIDLPSGSADSYPAVSVTLTEGLQRQQWQARLVRSEAALDRRSRMLVAIAELDGGSDRQLPIGAFVEATIQGRTLDDALVVPRTALYRGNQVLLVDEQSRIHYQPVQVLQNRSESAVIRGLAAGSRLVTNHLSLAIDGMRVTVSDRELTE